MFAYFKYKMTSMKILFAVISCLPLFSMAKLTTDVDIESQVKYQDGQWSGRVACTFYNQSDCLQSMHVDGRRIDVKSSKSNEDVFVSCFSPNKSIALSISNFTYEDIQDYSCLQDTTQQYNHTWPTTNPYIEVEGIQSYGNVVNLICNSVPGAPLYWILPGPPQDNVDVQIVNTSNKVNSSTTAFVRFEDIIYRSQYKCCSRSKDGQFPMACSSYTFYSDDPTAHLILTSSNFMNSHSMTMTCILQIDVNTFDPQWVSWNGCSTLSSQCSVFPTGYYTTMVDDTSKTLNTTFTTSHTSAYNYYKCNYEGSTFYTFEEQLESKGPFVNKSFTEVYYSTGGHAVKLSCLVSAYPQPSVTWTQTKMLESSNGTEIVPNGGNYEIEMTQISRTEWQTTLVIYPYDVNIHNNIYTCAVNNSLGQYSAQLNTNKGPADLGVKLVSNVHLTNTTNKIRAICTYQTFPFLPNYHINVISAETINLLSETISWDVIVDTATVTVDFEANVRQFPVTVECTAFNPFNSTSQVNGQLYVNSSTPIS